MAFEKKPQTVKELLREHWLVWKILGAVPDRKYFKLYLVYALIINIVFVIGYPLHLLLGLLNLVTVEEFCENLTITTPVIVCALKFLNLWRNLSKVRQLEEMFNKLYSRINMPSEWSYYRKVAVPNILKVLHLFYFLCVSAVVSSELTTIITGVIYGWRLMNSGYFPFDPHATNFNYVAAHLFQIIGFAFQGAADLASDTYGGMCWALLAGHAHLLGKRVACIGYDKCKTQQENNQELLKCTADHNMLFDCHRLITEIISFNMFIQIISASLSMGIAIIFLVFYVNNIIEYFNYGLFLFAVMMEVFPTCYFGTYCEFEFDKLTYMIFSCNWMDQSREFKKNLGIFVEKSLRRCNFKAGGMFRINLNIFFATCKGAYSLLAVALNMK